MRHPLATALIAAALATAAAACQARPEYAVREKKACGYCHVNPNGGGARNPRGVYYAMHNHTFDGYDEAKVMGGGAATPPAGKKAGLPAFKSAWTVEVPATAKRVAIADVTGDKKPRLLVLDDHNNLEVLSLSGDKATKEDEIALGDKAGSFEVGHFAKGKPAIVAVPGAIFIYDGGKFTKRAAPEVTDITGFARYADGTENFFAFGGGQPDSYAVDLSAAKSIVSGREIIDPSSGAGVYRELSIHPPVELLGQLGVPEEAQKAGVVGLFDPRGEGKLYAYLPWITNDGSTLRVSPPEGVGVGGNAADAKPVWTSDKLAGRVLDVAVATNPKDTAQTGLVVLLATGPDGKGRTVQFFALD